MSQEELEEYEAEGNVEETEAVLKEQNETQGYGICLDILNSLASIAAVLASKLGVFTSLVTDMKEVNEELKCNERIPKRIEENSKDLNYLKMTLPAVATNEDVRCEAENYPLYTLFRQGIMARTNCNGNNVMVYIGGASSLWRTGKRSHVSVYQFGAERRFPYNASMYQRMSELMKSKGIAGGYIVVLFGTERAEQEYVNPANPNNYESNQPPYSIIIPSYGERIKMITQDKIIPIIRDSQGHCFCNACSADAKSVSVMYPSFLLGLGSFFVVSQPPQFLQPRMYLVVGDNINEYYIGSPIYSTDEECGDARISGFVLQAFSLDEYCKLYAQATGKSFNVSVKNGGIVLRIPPPNSWNCEDIISWGESLGYERSFLKAYINLAIAVGLILSSFPEDYRDEIEDYIYGSEFSNCQDLKECENEVKMVADDIYNSLQSEDSDKLISIVHHCHEESITVDKDCYNSCFSQFKDKIKRLSVWDYYHLGEDGKDELASVMAEEECKKICSKFNANKYEECMENLYPGIRRHITE